ncbi:hypothetical protein LAZ67_7001376 [Cordylochernes scorpioides]|uniref:Reverse transcriptase domain-containing protein n=1 Tax=Cordylochernes scorpioides TaxID=51811 RepID=A0ABY6KM93_9ARAC|nr:hypothetical protein LAZ67_7001376 [Cordylochernes scorpioides]
MKILPKKSRSWAEIVEDEFTIFEQLKKRKHSPYLMKDSRTLFDQSRQATTNGNGTAPRQPSRPRNNIEQVKVYRQLLEQCRKISAAEAFDQILYLEHAQEFTPVDYIKAIEDKLGKSCVVPLGKVSGQVLVDLESPQMAETIIEEGLLINGILLKALPYQKKAEIITSSGLPYVIEDVDIIRTLRPYCQVVFIAPAVNTSGGYTWLDLKKTAFILMNKGKKITDLPHKEDHRDCQRRICLGLLGVRLPSLCCSKCYRMGHKRINCPLRAASIPQPSSQRNNVKPIEPSPTTTTAAHPSTALDRPAPEAFPGGLNPFGRVTSIVQQMMELANSCWADARREAFITLNDGVRLSQIPARLEIKTKGIITPVYVSYGIRCSLYHRQGHKRANCPQKAGMTEDKLLFSERPPVARPNVWSKPLASSSQASPAVAPTPAANILSSTATAVADPPLRDSNDQATVDQATTNESQKLPPSQENRNLAPRQMDGLVKNDKASAAIASVQQLELERGELLQAFTNKGLMDKLLAKSNAQQRQAIEHQRHPVEKVVTRQKLCSAAEMRFRVASLNTRGIAALRRRIKLCCFLKKHEIDICFLQETNVISLDEERDLCHGYSTVVVASPVSSLPAALPPAPAALAREEGAWILGDLNISEDSAKDLASGLAKALAELLDQADLVDIATFFDAALEHTRVATIGSRVDARRLDNILLPSGFCDRVTQYQTIDYAYSDHLAVLIQLGDPAPTRLHCIGKLLRSDLFFDRMETFIEETSEDLANLSPPMLWDHWTRIKADLVAEIRSLAPAVVESGGGYIERASQFLRRRLEDDTARSDYPALSDLGHSLRARRRSPSTFTDKDGNAISGGQLRRFLREHLSSRFAQVTSSVESNVDKSSLNQSQDPLQEQRNSINLTPSVKSTKTKKTAVRDNAWVVGDLNIDGGPAGATDSASVEALSNLLEQAALEDAATFFNLAHLPTRVADIEDYRVLAAILLRRLRPHLPTLAIDCQTYAIPGRSPSWNISRLTDEVEIATAGRLPLAVVSLDLESAFNSLNIGFLMWLLVFLGLPQAFIRWIQLLYAGANAAVRIGEHHTAAFPLINGVRQGCAVSAALFSLATTPLLRRLQSSLGEGNVIAYADDIVLMVRQEEHFDEVATIFQGFQRASGIRVNFRKSVSLWCGAWPARVYSPLDITWTDTSLRILGCDIRPRASAAMQEKHLLDLVDAAFRRWATFTRGLSLVGRARTANCLVLSSFMHNLHGYIPVDSSNSKLQAHLWVGARVGDLIGHGSLHLRVTRAALVDEAALSQYTSRLLEENCRGSYRVNGIGEAIVLRGTATPFQRLTTRTARRVLERPRLAALPITQLLGRWLPHVSIPISISWSSLRRCGFSGHNIDVAVRLALHALPHIAHPASARESCIACES